MLSAQLIAVKLRKLTVLQLTTKAIVSRFVHYLLQRNREKETAKAKEGDYDVVMRQLQFDLKAKVTKFGLANIQ